MKLIGQKDVILLMKYISIRIQLGLVTIIHVKYANVGIKLLAYIYLFITAEMHAEKHVSQI